MNDLRTQLPQCPLEYQVPHIPASHTALVIEINTADIEWQEKMLPWTLAGLINNTDIVMKGVHLYIACEDSTKNASEPHSRRSICHPAPSSRKTPKATNRLSSSEITDTGTIPSVSLTLTTGRSAVSVNAKTPPTLNSPLDTSYAIPGAGLSQMSVSTTKTTWMLKTPGFGCLNKKVGGVFNPELPYTSRKWEGFPTPKSPVIRRNNAKDSPSISSAQQNERNGSTLRTVLSMERTTKRKIRTSPPTSSMKPKQTGISTRPSCTTVPLK